MSFAKTMTDDELLAVVKDIDNIGQRLDRRFEGDDIALVRLMGKLGLKQTVVDKSLVVGEVLRECVHRGLQAPRGN